MVDNSEVPGPEEQALAERVAATVRSVESFDSAFERRLMDQVRDEGRILYPRPEFENASWWRKQRSVRISPLSGLAVAAGIVGIIVVSSVSIGTRMSTAVPASSSTKRTAEASSRIDTVHIVRFVFVDARAKTVDLVGDFNEWTKGITRLKPSGSPGVWAVSVAVPAGRHEYAFIIDGKRWIADPLATKSSDDFGTESSVIHVGSTAQSAA